MKNEKGFSMVEVLIALALLAIVAVGLQNGLGLAMASRGSFITDNQETAKNLAETQMEYVKGLPFSNSYVPTLIPAGSGNYTATINVGPAPGSPDTSGQNVQKVTVTIRNGTQVTAVLEDYRVR